MVIRDKPNVNTMKKSILILLFLMAINILLTAQITFERTYSDSGIVNATDVVATYDGGYALTGYKTCSSFNCLDFFLLKLDSLGNKQWLRLYDELGFDDLPNAIVQTTDSGFVMTGYASTPPNLGRNVRIVKTDKNGNLLWNRNYGGTGCEEGFDIQQTFDGGFIIATQADTEGTCSEILVELIKTDALGIIEWQKFYPTTSSGIAFSVKQTQDSGFVCTGSTGNMISPTSGGDVFLLKTDKNGNEQWVKFYGNEGSERGEDVIISSDGGFVIVVPTSGFFNSNIVATYIIKTNNIGDTLWTKVHEKDDQNVATSIIEDMSNNYVLTGYTSLSGSSSFYLLKLSNIGSKIWEKTFKDTPNSNTGANSIALAHDGGYIMCGITSGPGSPSVYVVKTDTGGLVVGINEITPTNAIVNVFPNPFNSYTTIDLTELLQTSNSITVSLIELTGKVVFETTTTESSFKLYNQNYSKGMYLLMLKNNTQLITTKNLW